MDYSKGQRNEKGQVICGAKTRSGKPCQTTQLGPSGRCRKHNGFAVKGVAHPAFKTGRHSKYMPEGLLTLYQDAVSDPDLLNLSSEIALVDAMIAEVIRKVDTHESGRIWERLREANRKLREARTEGDAVKMAHWMEQISHLIDAGATARDHRMELLTHIQNRKSLVEAETRRRTTMQFFVTAEQQMMVVSAVAHLVKENVQDPKALRAISNGLADLLNRRTPAPTEP